MAWLEIAAEAYAIERLTGPPDADPNTEELILTYKQIKAEPESWRQDTWGMRGHALTTFDRDREKYGIYNERPACGTAYCFAGHALVRNGYTLKWDNEFAKGCIEPDGQPNSISVAASELLGLNFDQALSLFAASNSLEQIRHMIKIITGVDPDE